jgi:hypothetical protein
MDRVGAEQFFKCCLEIILRARLATKQIQTKGGVFGKGVAGEMAFAEEQQTSNASWQGRSRRSKLVPASGLDGMEIHPVHQGGKKSFERFSMTEENRVTAVGFENPFMPSHLMLLVV